MSRRRQRRSTTESDGRRPETLWGALLTLVWSLPNIIRVLVMLVLCLGIGGLAVWTTFPDAAKDRFVRRVEQYLDRHDSTSAAPRNTTLSSETIHAAASDAETTIEFPDAAGERSISNTSPLDASVTDTTGDPLDQGEDPAADGNAVALMTKVQRFVGGAQNIRDVRTLKQISTLMINTPDGAIQATSETLMRLPDASRQEVTMPAGTITTVVSPKVSFVITPMGVQDLPPTQVKAARDDLEVSILVVLRNVGKSGYAYKSGGIARLDNTNLSLIQVSAPGGGSAIWFVETATGRLVRTVRQRDKVEQVVEYLEWKSVGNLRLPFRYVITSAGKESATAVVESVYLNPPTGGVEFLKPAD